MLISWKQKGVSGDFATASNWDPAAVPALGDDATIGAKGTYTVTSSVDETVDSLTIAKTKPTLFITGASTFTTTNGGVNDGTILVDNASVLNVGTTGQSTTLTNLGQIELGSAANAELLLAGDVSLQGNGKVTLSDDPNNSIRLTDPSAMLSTDNVISGAGIISGTTLVNEVGGIINASGVNPLHIDATLIENSGTLESTNPGGSLQVQLFSTINNTPLGVIEANGANTRVVLEEDVIVGGTLETRGANAVISIHDGNVLDGSQPGNPVNIIGNVQIVGETTVALAGTINNTGDITLVGGTIPWLITEGNVTLEGGGEITLTNPASSVPFGASAASIFGGVLTNMDNLISGTGEIGQQLSGSGVGTFINEPNGIIDANDASGPLVIAGVGPDTNAGLIEATQAATLLIENVTIDNFLNTTDGTVKAGSNSTIGLENATIVGGLVTAMRGAIIEAEQGSNTITGAVVTNAGTIGAEGANLTIVGDVTNTGTLDANNATLLIDGAVSGGKATLEGTGEIEFGGPSSANTTFAANSDAILKLDAPSTFTGTVSGLTTGDYIDLTNINFADNPTLGYSSKTHVLTVTDSVSQVTDTITFKGAVGSFSAQSDGNGGTFITDPPAIVTVSHDSFVFATNLGENGSKATNAPMHHEPIDFWHPGGDFPEGLIGQAHAEESHHIAAPDAIDGHHAAALAQHHFLV
jgi:hypothetical protein